MTPPGQALASANADFRNWNIGSRELLTPLEKKLRRLRYFRIGTTTDAKPHDDGTYTENGFAFTSGWTQPSDRNEGMAPEEVVRLIRSADSYVTCLDTFPDAFLSIQHIDAAKWFRDAAMAGEKYKLRLGLRLMRESDRWSRLEPRGDRANAFKWRHPVFFHIDYVELLG
jgi:hypothetical protein